MTQLKSDVLQKIGTLENRLAIARLLNVPDQNIYKMVKNNSEELTKVKYLNAISKVLGVENITDLVSELEPA